MSRKIITALMIILMSVFMVIAPGRRIFDCDGSFPPGAGCESQEGPVVTPEYFVIPLP